MEEVQSSPDLPASLASPGLPANPPSSPSSLDKGSNLPFPQWPFSTMLIWQIGLLYQLIIKQDYNPEHQKAYRELSDLLCVKKESVPDHELMQRALLQIAQQFGFDTMLDPASLSELSKADAFCLGCTSLCDQGTSNFRSFAIYHLNADVKKDLHKLASECEPSARFQFPFLMQFTGYFKPFSPLVKQQLSPSEPDIMQVYKNLTSFIEEGTLFYYPAGPNFKKIELTNAAKICANTGLFTEECAPRVQVLRQLISIVKNYGIEEIKSCKDAAILAKVTEFNAKFGAGAEDRYYRSLFSQEFQILYIAFYISRTWFFSKYIHAWIWELNESSRGVLREWLLQGVFKPEIWTRIYRWFPNPELHVALAALYFVPPSPSDHLTESELNLGIVPMGRKLSCAD
jgi:hypothetical protein